MRWTELNHHRVTTLPNNYVDNLQRASRTASYATTFNTRSHHSVISTLYSTAQWKLSCTNTIRVRLCCSCMSILFTYKVCRNSAVCAINEAIRQWLLKEWTLLLRPLVQFSSEHQLKWAEVRLVSVSAIYERSSFWTTNSYIDTYVTPIITTPSATLLTRNIGTPSNVSCSYRLGATWRIRVNYQTTSGPKNPHQISWKSNRPFRHYC